MKRKLSLILTIILCLSALLVLTSCDFVLDLIFGSKTPPDNSNTNEPPAHTHKMIAQTYVGETCSAQKEIKYYKCSECNKCYLDEQGEDEIVDISSLGGHVFVIRRNDTEHYFECSLCNTVQDGSRGQHTSESEHWWYNPDNHYKLCDVCGAKFSIGSHDETGSCSCRRRADYKSMCNSRYGYEQLVTLERGADMQKLYDKIDNAVSSAHDNANFNTASLDVDFNIDMFLNTADVKITVATYSHDNPLYYWIDWHEKGCSFKFPAGEEGRPDNEKRCTGVVINLLQEYSQGAQRVAQNAVIYSQIDAYLSEVSDESDPYYIALGLHDAIIDNVDYAYKADGNAETAAWAHSIAGVFDKKSTLTNNNAAVCEGYAKAYQLLLNACGVSNVYVTGTSHNVGHAWNLVQLNNKNWYYFDLTWDDQPNRVNGKTYDYFCKTEGEFNSDHKPTVSDIDDGINYLYDLPEAATEKYSPDSQRVNDTFSQQGFKFKLVGYNKVSVLKVADEEIATIPARVEHDGRTYKVTQIEKEALYASYQYASDGQTLLYKVSLNVVKLVIPQTVEVIYSRSFSDCNTFEHVEFADCSGWQRYALTGQTPVYQQLSLYNLSNASQACSLLKEKYRPNLLSQGYTYVWVKTAD